MLVLSKLVKSTQKCDTQQLCGLQLTIKTTAKRMHL